MRTDVPVGDGNSSKPTSNVGAEPLYNVSAQRAAPPPPFQRSANRKKSKSRRSSSAMQQQQRSRAAATDATQLPTSAAASSKPSQPAATVAPSFSASVASSSSGTTCATTERSTIELLRAELNHSRLREKELTLRLDHMQKQLDQLLGMLAMFMGANSAASTPAPLLPTPFSVAALQQHTSLPAPTLGSA